MLTTAGQARGFSLIELMVALAVLMLILTAVMPSIGTWVADARIRSAAESLQNGLRLAQSEAMRRNRQSVFALTQLPPALTARPSTDGRNWYARVLPLAGSDESDNSSSDADAQGRFIQGGTFATQSAVAIAGPALVCFSPLGRQITLDSTATGLNAACTAADPVAYTLTSTAASSARRLKVLVYLGGRVRMCDPARTLSSANPDGC